VPEFKKQHPDVKANLIFVDGGHDVAVAAADLENFGSMADPTYNVLLMDDVMCNVSYCDGPNDAWHQLLQSGAAVQLSGHPVAGGDRGFAIGTYQDSQ